MLASSFSSCELIQEVSKNDYVFSKQQYKKEIEIALGKRMKELRIRRRQRTGNN